MTPKQYDQMRSIFLEARDLPASQRGKYLERACAGDGTLRKEVESLLGDEAAGQSFLSQPAMAGAGANVSADIVGALGGTGGARPMDTGQSFTTIPDGRTDSTFLAGYELLSEIHRGGQGIVYKAMQRSTNRLVALKVLPEGPLASDRQKHRFEREVTLAASLRHPNIVTIHDSGLTSGRYYYVMEYVHGQPLHDYLATHPLAVDQKLRLFATICSAVGHAHQHGVIHRDLKPGNILIDARGEPHVVDFGLAKTAPVSALRDGSPVTATSQFLGTLAYASPEQTLGAPEMVDARSDVYSLGVVLFEMLTGQLPYRITSDMVASLQTVRDAAPARPSSLNRELNTELDTIALRALSKEPIRRYQTVADLGMDVDRYLAGEPILARRDSITYIIRKRSTAMMRRHRVVSLGFAALLATVLTWWWVAGVYMYWNWPIAAFERLASATRPVPAPGSTFEDVRLIAIDDNTVPLVADMAAKEGFADVAATPWRSVRRLHGRLMERLATAGILGLAWDIEFRDHEPYNADFILGVEALQQANVNPVIVVGTWTMDTERDKLMAPDILESGVAWGCSPIGADAKGDWRVNLILERSESAQMIGLSLAAIGAARHPTMDMSANLDVASQSVQLRYLPMESDFRQAALLAASDRFNLKGVLIAADDAPETGLRVGDVVGEFAVTLPDQATMDRVTIPYHKAFFMTNDELKAAFGGKLILVVDQRSEPTTTDWSDAPDGRRVHRGWAHAAAMDALHREAGTMQYAQGSGYFAYVLLGSVAGALASIRIRFRFFSIVWRLAAGLAAFMVVGLVVNWSAGYLLPPVVPFTAMVLTLVGLGVIERLGGREIAEGRKGSSQWSTVHP